MLYLRFIESGPVAADSVGRKISTMRTTVAFHPLLSSCRQVAIGIGRIRGPRNQTSITCDWNGGFTDLSQNASMADAVSDVQGKQEPMCGAVV